MSYSDNFAVKLKEYRRVKGLTQRELAVKLGYSEKTVSKWECGASVPPIDALFEIARLLGTTLEGLFRTDERYYLAIDGGGTKTALLLADRDGKVIRNHRTTACNHVDIGFEGAKDVLTRAIDEICHGIPRSEITAFAGIAGGTSAGMRGRLREFFSSLGFAAFDNDSDIANIIAVGLGVRDGIVMILGTGVCVFVKENGERFQIAGRGYLIDEGGSGYNLGRDALSAYFGALDGSGEPTLLTEEIDSLYEGGANAIMSYIYNGKDRKKTIASFAPTVYTAIERGDKVARNILERNMRVAAHLAEAGRKRLPAGERVPLVLAGGLTSRELTVTLFRESLANPDDFDIRVLDSEPVMGALELAMTLKGDK